MYGEQLYLISSINNAAIPPIITEHNSKTSLTWNTLATTADDYTEAAQLASQISFIILAQITTHFVFKFSVCPSAIAGQEVSKNGLHWGEIYNDPYPIADTTLSAEHYRLLTKMIGATMYEPTKTDSSNTTTYLSAESTDGFNYLFTTNDQNNTLSLSIDVSAFGPQIGSQIIVEAAGPNYWGEVYTILNVTGQRLACTLNEYTTLRFAIPIGPQSMSVANASVTCTAQAGANSNVNSCSSPTIQVGTSNTAAHETTSVALLQFPFQ
jgi:hypothetical protein